MKPGINYTKNTIAAYEKNAKEYARKKAGRLKDSKPFLEKFITYFKGKQVLEIGFGLGQDAAWFINKGFDYTGIEPVKNFFDEFVKEYPNARILNTTIQKTNFKANSFDAIYTMATLLHLSNNDLIQAINKCHRWLRKNGVLFITIKKGKGSLIKEDGRYFNLFTRERFRKFYKDKFTLLDFSESPPTKYNTTIANWLNFYLKKI